MACAAAGLLSSLLASDPAAAQTNAAARANATDAPAPRADVEILRDRFGVPHIYADSIHDLFFGYGYAVAEDRLFQLEMAKRSVNGTVAEVLGPDYVGFDIATRRSGDAEIHQHRLVVGADHDVRWLEVPMHDAGFMGRDQCRR